MVWRACIEWPSLSEGLLLTCALLLCALLLCALLPCQTGHAHSTEGMPQVSGSKRLVSRMAAPEPSPACMVCGTAQAQLAVDVNIMTLQQLVEKVGPVQV